MSGDGALPYHLQFWIFLGLSAGFVIKVPLFPFHTWLPLAHTEAPTAGSVVLAGVLLKLGTYGFLRLCLPLLPDATLRLGVPLVGTLAVIGIIYGALCSIAQQDIKKLVAYSSVSHLGFCMLGMFALNAEGISGSVLQMVNHGLSTGALFLLVGMLYDRYHTRMMTDLGGLAARLPLLACGMVFICLSSVGLPGLNGFVGEVLSLIGMFKFHAVYAVFGDNGNHPRRLVPADHAPAFVLRPVERTGHARRDGSRLEFPRTGGAGSAGGAVPVDRRVSQTRAGLDSAGRAGRRQDLREANGSAPSGTSVRRG